MTRNGRSDLPQSPSRTHTMDAHGGRIVDHTRYVATAHDRAGHGAPGHEATLPSAAAGNATQGILPLCVRDACRASTSCTHTVARPHAMRPSRADSLRAPFESFCELGRARQARPTVLATLRHQSATQARDNRSAQWMVCGHTSTLAVRTGQSSRVMVVSNLGRSATAARGRRSAPMGGPTAASRGGCSTT